MLSVVCGLGVALRDCSGARLNAKSASAHSGKFRMSRGSKRASAVCNKCVMADGWGMIGFPECIFINSLQAATPGEPVSRLPPSGRKSGQGDEIRGSSERYLVVTYLLSKGGEQPAASNYHSHGKAGVIKV